MQAWIPGFVVAVVSVGLWPRLPEQSVSILLCTCAAILFVRCSKFLRFCSGITAGLALGIYHGNTLLEHRLHESCVNVPLQVSGTVVSLPRLTGFARGSVRQQFVFEVESIDPSGCSDPRRVQLSYYGSERILPGQHWQFGVSLKKPWGLENPAGYNRQQWYAASGIDAVGSVQRSAQALRLSEKNRLLQMPDRLRYRLSQHIASLGLSSDTAAILRAVTVADRSGIDDRLWQRLQQFGVSHLVVISGLHVGLVAGFGFVLVLLCRRLTSLHGLTAGFAYSFVPLILAAAYVSLAGFSLPTQRALYMLTCFTFARMANRNNSAFNSLLIAATLVLVINPLAALGSGFWLSFGAVAALLWVSRWHSGRNAGYRVVAAQAFLSLMMLPLGGFLYGGGSLVSLCANLLMIPLFGFVVVPLSLTASLAHLSGWSAEMTLWQLAAWPLDAVLPVAEALSQDLGAWLYHHVTAGVAVALLGLLSVVILTLPTSAASKLPGLILALPLCLPVSPASVVPQGDTRVTVLDVGQGTAVVVHSGERALLYDTGGGDPAGFNLAASLILPFLRSQGLESLDTLVISHADLDHSAGATSLLQALPVARLRYGGNVEGVSTGRSCGAGESWRWPGGQTFRFLSPATETTPKRNNSSCVLQVQVGKQRLLLPGDIEERRERTLLRYWGDEVISDWLLVAHHGSQTSTSRTFLKRVRPGAAVLSHGYANRFGHPHSVVLENLQWSGSIVHSTAGEGAVMFGFSDGESPRVVSSRYARRRYWM